MGARAGDSESLRCRLACVTYDEALSELGLEQVVEPDVVRRAYLRTIKTRKPETDPEGFRRARDAYELLREAPPFVMPQRAPSVEPEEPPVLEEGAPAPIVREIVDAEVDPTAGRNIGQLLRRDEIDEAGTVARDRLEFALENPQAYVHIESALFLVLVLRLHATGEHARARAITRKLRRWLEAHGMGARIGPEAAARLAIARDLANLHEGFPTELLRAFAQAALDGERLAGANAIGRYVGRDPKGRAYIQVTLSNEAPSLFVLYADLLRPDRGRPAWGWSQNRNPFWYVVPLLFIVSRFLGPILDPPRPTVTVPDIPEYHVSPPTVYEPTRTEEKATPMPTMLPVHKFKAAEHLAVELESVGATNVSLYALKIAATSDCVEAFQVYGDMRNEMKALSPLQKSAAVVTACNALRDQIAEVCSLRREVMP